MSSQGLRTLIQGTSDYGLIKEGIQYSYFLERYAAEPKFQTQMLTVPFDSIAHYGDLFSQIIPHNGDLLTRIYVKFTLPDIPFNQFGNRIAVYANNIGNYVIEYAELLVNRKSVEKYYGEFKNMMEEITIPQIKQPFVSDVTGKNVYGSGAGGTYYTLIPFSLCQKGLPLLAINSGSLEIRIKFRESINFLFPPYLITDPIQGTFLFEYVYLSDKEAQVFQTSKKTYLVEQTQLYQAAIPPSVSNVVYNLNFLNPVKEIFFVVQYQTVTQNVFDFTYSTTQTDHITSLNLNMAGLDVIDKKLATPLYLRVIQPMDYHVRIPTATIFYMYSFCIDPENIEPTGFFNFGRVQQQLLTLNVVPSNLSRYVRVYARSYNIFTTENGVGKLIFNTSDG